MRHILLNILQSTQSVTSILAMPGVEAVYPVRLYDPPKPLRTARVTNSSVPVYTPHVPTGVQRLHEEGILGAGVKIAIIDTGVDYNHPVLGPQGFGPGHKVIGGYDFVGDDYDGLNTPKPDPDPMDCNSHGTHVAGIIGANIGSNPYGIIGSAPSASILAYRVFGCEGPSPDEIIIDALLRAHKDKADVMNLSLGEASGWSSSPSSVVASRLAQKGYVMCISAGNDGAEGAWYSSSPANGVDIISVASVDNTIVYWQRANVSTGYGPITYASFDPLPVNGSRSIYATSTDTTVANDACSPLPDSTPDLSPYVVIIRRGGCNFVDKLANAAAKGMQVALIYNNGGSFGSIIVGNYTAALISAEDGAYLVSQFAAGNNITISFPQTAAHATPDPTGGLMSDFSSYGPNFDMLQKPSIAAFGGSILSSVPDGEYAIYSGTSMAAPYIAGSSALVLQALGINKPTGKKVRGLFEATASYLKTSHNETDPYESVIKQGAGLVQVYNAIKYKTVVNKPEVLLNDTAHYVPKHVIEYKNTGKTSLKYVMGHVPAGTALTYDPELGFANLAPVPLTASSTASLSFSQTSFTLSPGKSTKITVTVTLPTGLNPKTYPIYSGWITATASNGEILSVPYTGVASNLHDLKVLDTSSYYFDVPLPAMLNARGDIQTAPTNYTFKTGDTPKFLWRLAAGTARQTIDLVAVDTNVPTTGSYASVPIIGNILSKAYLPRNGLTGDNETDYNLVPWTNSTFTNGTKIPDGQYRVLLRALKITGDPSAQGEYESWLSEIVGVNNGTTATPPPTRTSTSIPATTATATTVSRTSITDSTSVGPGTTTLL
ncbi:subtilisin-like protease [Serendipita vermifera]|nr:subtilisin-like protease [Serendipita vermifera]